MASGTMPGQGAGYDSHGQDGSPIPSPPVNLYTPRETPSEGEMLRVPVDVNPEGEMLSVEERGAPGATPASKVPYYEVIGEYSKTAEEAVEREEVPPGYREPVKDYFRALQDGAKKPRAAGEQDETED